jgi:hypothetical protein
MSKRGWIFVAAAACWLVGGVAFKAARLTHAQEQVAENATTRLTEFLADFGWEPSSDVTGSVSAIYTTLLFEKDGCTGTLVAVLLGPSADSEHLLKTTFHDDVVFIQNGNIARNLDGISHHIRYFVAPLLSTLGLSAAGAWPIVAISPSPPVAASACSAPPIEAWHTLYTGRRVANSTGP